METSFSYDDAHQQYPPIIISLFSEYFHAIANAHGSVSTKITCLTMSKWKLLSHCYNLLAIMIVLALPPRLSLRSHVKTEFLYGMKALFLVVGVDDVRGLEAAKSPSSLTRLSKLLEAVRRIEFSAESK